MQTFRGHLRRALYTPIVVMFACACVLVYVIAQLVNRAEWVDHTYRVISQANRAYMLMPQIQSGARSFQITGKTNFLIPYIEARRSIDPEFSMLEEMVADNPTQVQAARSFRTKAQQFATYAGELVSKGPQAFEERRVAEQSRLVALREEVEQAYQTFVDHEEILLNTRTGRFALLSQTSALGLGAGALVVGIIVGLGVRRQLLEINRTHEAAVRQLQSTSESLRQSEEQFRAVFERAAVGIGRVSFRDATWMDTNDALCRMVGYTCEEMRGKRWPQVTFPEDVDIDLELFKKMAAGEIESYAVEKRFVHKDGHLVWARLTLSLAKDAKGNPDCEIAVVEDITERKANQEAASRLATIVSSSSNPIVSKTLEGTILTWNQAAEKVFGFTAAEVIGKSILIVVPKEKHREELELLSRVKRGEFVEHYETVRVTKYGDRLTVSISLSAIMNSTGEIVSVSSIIRDITEQKRAAEMLAMERAFAEAILTAAPAGIIVADRSGKLIRANPANLRIWGPIPMARSVDQYAEFKGWWADGSERQGRLVKAEEWTLARALRGEVAPADVYEIEPFDAPRTRRTILNSGAPIRGESGEILGAVIVQVDITAQRNAELAWRRSEARLTTVIDHLEEGLVVANEKGDLIYWNPAAQTMHGYHSQAGTAANLAHLVGIFELRTLEGELLPLEQWPMSRILQGEKVRGCELRVRRTDQSWEKILSYSGSMVQTATGDRVASLSIFDLTEQRAAEAALRESEARYRSLSEELEERVQKRTLELSEANERLKEVDRLKSEFLATMSHELRTPLNSIIGFNEIIAAGLAGPINDEQQKQLGMSLTSAKHLLNLINDLLDLARIESGRVQPHYESFDFKNVVDQVMETLRPIAARKKLPVETKLEGDLRMSSDRKMVFQILLNLANNAVKFTDFGKVEIRVKRVDNQLEIRVSDTGIGIKAQNLNQLFEAFRQIDSSTQRRFEGTGLGLYLSKRLVTLLGGMISVQSEYGEGSTFTVVIPVSGDATK